MVYKVMNEISKKKVLFIMGATGTGKTKLSIDLATRFSGEIINSDKIQVYRGLDIVTNKVPVSERHGVPHHLLGFLNPEADFTVQDFCYSTLNAIDKIAGNNRLPIVVGGSNSYIQALVEDTELKCKYMYDCCFLWVDAALPILYKHVERRVDLMVNAGLVDEVRDFYVEGADYTRGIRRAIGVPELHSYFEAEKNISDIANAKHLLLNNAIQEIKSNTCRLVDRQREKIQRLRSERGWKMHLIDTTCVLGKSGKAAEDAWEERVLKPSMEITSDFLKEDNETN